jgi:hypothetical protein
VIDPLILGPILSIKVYIEKREEYNENLFPFEMWYGETREEKQ